MLKQNKKSLLSLFLLLFFMANFFVVNVKPAKADESSILPTSSLLTLGSKLGSVGTGVSLGTELVTSIAGGKVGEAVASGANDYVAKPLLLTLLYFVKVLPIAGLSALTWVLEPDITINVLENSNIYIFWAFVRDILNMFFVIILLFSAFATIFQIEKYNYKKIMAKLIFAAFLVNFSFPITRIFIDISNVLLYSLVNIMSVSFYDPQQGAMAILNFSGYAGLIAPAMESSSTSLIISIIAIFLIGITFIAMSFLFIIRLFAFVLLIIFSPVAFVAPAIPGAEKFGSMWWSNLLKYAFFAPIMMLFFYIAIAFMHALNTSGLELQKISGENVSATSQSVVSNLILCLVPVVIIWIGMGIANKFGIAGAEATMGRAKKFAKWTGVTAPKWLAKKGAHKFERDVLAKKGLSPKAFLEAWKARQTELDTKKFAPATGAWRDRLNKAFEGRETRYEDAANQSLIAQRQKEMEAVSKDAKYLYKQLQEAEKSGDKETAVAALRIMASENDLNDFMAVLQPKSFTAKGVLDEIQERLNNRKFDFAEGEIDKHISDIGDIGFSKGNFQLYGGAEFDSETGRYKRTSEERQRELALGKAQNLKAQTKADLMHYNSLFDMIHDGKKEDGSNKFKFVLSKFGKGLLKQLNDNFIDKNLARVRDDLVDVSYSNITQIHNYANVELKNEATNLRTIGKLEEAAAIENKISLINKFVKEMKKKKEKRKSNRRKQRGAKKTTWSTKI